MKESDLVDPILELLESEGWFAMASIDRTDFYDIAAVRGDPVEGEHDLMLIELKLSSPKAVYMQASKRRLISDYTSIGMPSLKSLTTVEKYDSEYQNVMGLLQVDDKNATWIKQPVKNDAPTRSTRNRIAGVLFAYKMGYFNDVCKPTATFTYWNTDTMMGVPVKKLTANWDYRVRRLIGVKDAPSQTNIVNF